MKPNKATDVFFMSLVYSGVLEVSRCGEVFNTITQNYIGYTTNKGYIGIGVKLKGKTQHILVHRLVYMLYGEYLLDDEWPIVNHKDSDKINNCEENLERSNDSHNLLHSFNAGMRENNRIASVKNIKIAQISRHIFSEKDIKLIHNYYIMGAGFREIGRRMSTNHTTISNIINGRTYKEFASVA